MPKKLQKIEDVISNHKKHELAVKAVTIAHNLNGEAVRNGNEETKIPHDVMVREGDKTLPGVVIYKQKSYSKVGVVQKHGWNSDRLYTLKGTAEAEGTDVVIFIVDVERGSILRQLLSVLLKPVTIRGEQFPEGITAKKTAQETFFALEQFTVYSGIPYEAFHAMYEAISEKQDDLFSMPLTPLLDAINGAGRSGYSVGLQTVDNTMVVNLRKGNKRYGGSFKPKADSELPVIINRLYMDAIGLCVYFVIPKKRATEVEELYTGLALAEAVALEGEPFSTHEQAKEYVESRGGVIYGARYSSNGVVDVKVPGSKATKKINEVYKP